MILLLIRILIGGVLVYLLGTKGETLVAVSVAWIILTKELSSLEVLALKFKNKKKKIKFGKTE